MSFFWNVTFVLALNSIFVYFETHDCLKNTLFCFILIKHVHYIFLSKTLDIKILCCKNTKTQFNVYINPWEQTL